VKRYTPSESVLELLGLTEASLRNIRPKRGTGCPRCSDTGYYGRLAVFEVLQVTRTLRELLIDGADDTAIARQARQEGMSTLRESALTMAGRGLTTYEEVARVTPPDP